MKILLAGCIHAVVSMISELHEEVIIREWILDVDERNVLVAVHMFRVLSNTQNDSLFIEFWFVGYCTEAIEFAFLIRRLYCEFILIRSQSQSKPAINLL